MFILVLGYLPLSASGQQVSDDSFRFKNEPPAFRLGEGPLVCIDEAHFNFHTADGRYKSFASMLRDDGYVVEGYSSALTSHSLQQCGLLVIANALAEENKEDWSYPHPSAFTREEMKELLQWVQNGGRFLLFADHAPIAGAARDLAAVFGVFMSDVYVDGGPGPDFFHLGDTTLVQHSIQRGRFLSEKVDSVLTFTGQAFQVTDGWEPLLVFGPNAIASISPTQAFQPDASKRAMFSVAGWVHGAARSWKKGRVVFLGEAAMCSAQLAGPDRNPMGMNNPMASQNSQFCLNIVRWLTGVID